MSRSILGVLRYFVIASVLHLATLLHHVTTLLQTHNTSNNSVTSRNNSVTHLSTHPTTLLTTQQLCYRHPKHYVNQRTHYVWQCETIHNIPPHIGNITESAAITKPTKIASKYMLNLIAFAKRYNTACEYQLTLWHASRRFGCFSRARTHFRPCDECKTCYDIENSEIY